MHDNIYLHINHKETKKKMRIFILDLNEKRRIANPKGYKSSQIKGSVISTIEAIFDMFGAWLLHNKKMGLIPDKKHCFRLNNVWIATKRGAIDKSTIYRHIKILENAKIITHKKFLGTKVSYEIGINPDLLVSHEDKTYTELLTAIFLDVNNITEITDLPNEVRVLITTQKPLFIDYPEGFLIAKCNHIITKNIFKINEDIGKILQGQNFNSFFILPEHGSSVSPLAEKFSFSEFPLKKSFSGGGGLEFSKVSIISKNNEEKNLKPTFDFDKQDDLKNHWLNNAVDDCMYLLLSMLYSGKTFPKEELELARKHLKVWLGNGSKQHIAIKISIRKFAYLVLKCKSYLDASPERFIPKLSKWLDPNFEHGFKGVLRWDESDKINKAELESFNINRKLLAKLLIEYYAEPNINTYQHGRDILSKKKDKKLLALFNKCIVDKNNFTNKEFEKYNSKILSKKKK